MIETDEGVFTSFGLFDSTAQADESTRIAADWVGDEKLEATLPNPPLVPSGEIVAHRANGNVTA